MVSVKMPTLPQKIKESLRAIVDDLCLQESVIGVGLFGSWARGDASPYSDVDLLIADRRNLPCEIMDRLEHDGTFFDLEYIPERWFSRVPPTIDQKIHELKILYDPNMVLADVKRWMTEKYDDPDRINSRCERHFIDSTVFLSRSRSALGRGDHLSAAVFLTKAIDYAYMSLLEVSFVPISLSRYVNDVQRVCSILKMGPYYDRYLQVHRFERPSRSSVEKFFSMLVFSLEGLSSFVDKHPGIIKGLYVKQGAMLRYYSKAAFKRGMAGRLRSIIDAGSYVEAVHYIRSVLLDVLENAIWAIGATAGVRPDQTVLLSFLEKFDVAKEFYGCTLKVFNLEELGRDDVHKLIALTDGLTPKLREEKTRRIEKLAKATS